MKRNRILIVTAASALTYTLASRADSGNVLLILPWIVLGGFSFWKAWVSPRKWGGRLGGFYALVLSIQILLLHGYLKKVGDPRYWSLIIPMAVPLLIIIACFSALSFLPEEIER